MIVPANTRSANNLNLNCKDDRQWTSHDTSRSASTATGS